MSLFPTHWYYNTESGQLTLGNNLENLGNNLFGGAGWHELNIPGSATATAAAAEAKKEFPKGSAPTNAGITPARVAQVATGEAANAAGVGGGNPLAGLAQVGQFFSALSQGSTWIRVAEGILGIILLAVGVARITHAVPIATKIAGAVA